MAIILGIAGLLCASAALWIRNERRQDVWFIIGGLFLLGYSLFRHDLIFTVLQIVFISSASIELLKLRKKK